MTALVLGALLILTLFAKSPPALATQQYGPAQAVVTGQSEPVGLALAGSGTLYWVDFGSGQLMSLAPGSSSPTVLLTDLSEPQGLGVDNAGNLYFTEYTAGTLDELKVGSSAKTILASGLSYPNFLSVTPAGDVYFITGQTCGNAIEKYDHSTGLVSTVLTTTAGTGNGYGGVYVDAAGDVYFTTCQAQTVDVLQAGSSSPQVLASGIPYANGIVGDSVGDLFIASYYSGIYMLPEGSSTPVEITAQSTAHEMIALDSADDVYYSDNTGGKIWEVPNQGSQSTITVTETTITDFPQLVQAFENLSARYSQLAASFSQLSGNQQSLATSYASQAQSYAALASEYANQTRSLSVLSSNFQSLSSEYSALSQNYASLSSNYGSMSARLDSYELFTYLLAAALVVVVLAAFWLLRRPKTS